MIENMSEQDQKNRQIAKRKGVSPSSSLRPHFVALARQVQRWASDKKRHQTGPLNIGITSLDTRAGRSTVSFNLAAALVSVVRDKILLVEADFGKHYITRRLGRARSTGLAELVLGFEEASDVIHETPLNGLFVLGCGRKSGQEALELPFDLLQNVISEKFDEFGFVVFDLPVASHLTACYSIANQLDGVILTVEANQIDQRQINRFKKQMETFGVEIIGVVINKS